MKGSGCREIPQHPLWTFSQAKPCFQDTTPWKDACLESPYFFTNFLSLLTTTPR